jgi:hypothetical protein
LISRTKSTGHEPGLKPNHDEQVFFDAECVSVVYERVFHLVMKRVGVFFGQYGCN